MLELRDELGAALADRYTFERELGRGGMAIVYLARDLKHNRRVAIKVLRSDLSTTLGAERFLREIAIAARLTHPNILSLHDSGDADGVLYFVMPYVDGESLRARLERERQLPVVEAVAIARQVAAALDYAHAQGVVHRDIKPENILLIGDHALVADFGLARAVYSAASHNLTESGVAVGTPAYISPEQASAERAVDGRTDVYSLACVVFEMIAGVPPYRGATAQAVIAHHVSSPPPSLCAERASCPAAFDASVQRALAKVPADRFRTAGEFVQSLEVTGSLETGAGRVSGGATVSRGAWRRPVVLGAIAALVTAVSAGVAVKLARGNTPPLDASRVIALPLTMTGSTAGSDQVTRDATQRLSDALGQWSDVKVEDDRTTREALEAAGKAPLRTVEAMAIARRLGAGRLVWGDVSATPDSVTVRASLYDVSQGVVAREARITYPARASSVVQPYRELANRLLRDRDELPWTKPDESWPASLAAWTAYDSARKALETWDLTTAESRLRDALRIQPEFPQAELWLAQVLSWKTFALPPEATRRAAEEQRVLTSRALNWSSRLTAIDREAAEALRSLAEHRYPDACNAYRALTNTTPNDFRVWFGLGDCENLDPVVVPDAASPSGYAFRGSWHSAAMAYEHALETLAAAPPAFLYERLKRVLITDFTHYRGGRLVTDSSMFVSPPVLLHDTLAYVPYAAGVASSAVVDQAAVNRAVQSDVERFTRSLRAWVRLSPQDPVAHAMLGELLEKGGIIVSSAEDSLAAISQVRAARALTTDSMARLSLSNDLVRLEIKADSFTSGATLADSIISSILKPGTQQDLELVGLAALLGKRRLVKEFLRPLMEFPRFGPTTPDGRPLSAPPSVLDVAADAAARAALGICDDTLRAFSSHLTTILASYVPDSASRETLRSAIARPILSAAVPCLGPPAVAGLRSQDLLIRQQQRFAESGRAFRATFDSVQVLRKGWRPGDVAIDYTFQEAWLLLEAGDTAAAVKHLDGTLDALPTLSNQLLELPFQAAALVRAMALRAELADRLGEHTKAVRWGNAVSAMWSQADTDLVPVKRRMITLRSARH